MRILVEIDQQMQIVIIIIFSDFHAIAVRKGSHM